MPASPPIEADARSDDAADLDAADARPVDAPGDGPSDTAVTLRDPCRSGIALPGDSHFTAPGTCARAVGKGPGPMRQITFAPDGDLFGVTKDGVIVRMHDADDDGNFAVAEITEWGNTGGNGNNCHISLEEGATEGWLYAGTPNGVARFKWSAGSAKAGEKQDLIVDQPGGGHGLHTTHVYPDESGKGRFLYVHSGSAGNATDPMSPGYDADRSLIKRFDLAKYTPGTPFSWNDGELVVVGTRNVVGFNRSARLGKIFGVVNGMDNVTYKGVDVHNDNPGEQVVLVEKGKQYGYPFCFTAQRVVDGDSLVPAGTQLRFEGFISNTHDDAWCQANSSKPLSFLQAHSAPLDIVFFDGALPSGGLPDRYRNGAFISLHGSWDRDPSTGYKVIWLPFDDAGNPPMPTSTKSATTFPYEVVFGGGKSGAPQDGAWTWNASGQGESPRPVGVAISPVDGALYIASDSVGWVYRVGRAR